MFKKKLNYFKECKSLDEVKAEYKRCVQRWLPTESNAGNKSQMDMLDNEYYEISGKNGQVDPLSPIEADHWKPGLLDPPIFHKNDKELFLS